MTSPGRLVGRGMLRVDAARAVAKLREYQLTSPFDWILEAVRSFVSFGATRLRVVSDADDVWLLYEGPSPSAKELAHLYDELVSPVSSEEKRPYRLLAIAVNTALATRARFVDVYAIEGRATRIRYTPDVLPEVGDDARFPELLATEHEAPHGVTRGGAVHLRRSIDRDVMFRALVGGEHPEHRALRQACADLGVELVIEASPFRRDRDLLRVTFEETGELAGYRDRGITGWLALTRAIDREEEGTTLELAERGVLMQRRELAIGLRSAPLRLYLDAPALPTNASRSQVRIEQHITDVIDCARPMLAALVAKIEAALTTEDDASRVAIRAATLQLLAATSETLAPTVHLVHELAPLMSLPLLVDAIGRRRSVHDMMPSLTRALPVHRGTGPLAADLAPWVGGLLWCAPGSETEHLLRDVPLPDASRIAKQAMLSAEAHRDFMAHAPRTVRPRDHANVDVTVTFDEMVKDDRPSLVPSVLFAGMRGEVSLLLFGDSGLVVHVLHYEREITRSTFPMAVSAVAEVSGDGFAPRWDYRELERNASYEQGMQAARAGVVRALEALARRTIAGEGQAADGAPSVAVARMIRASLPDALRIAGDAQYRVQRVAPEVGSASPLFAARIFPTVRSRLRGEPPLSFQELVAQAAASWQQLAFARPGSTDEIDHVMPILELDPGEVDALRPSLPANVLLLDYTRIATEPRGRAMSRAMWSRGKPTFSFRAGSADFTVRWDRQTQLVRLYHHGRVLVERQHSQRVVPCTIGIDHDRTIPDASFSLALVDPSLGFAFEPIERAFLEAVARSALGETLVGFEPEGADLPALALEALGHSPAAAEALSPDLIERIRAADWVRLAYSERLVSLAYLASEVARGTRIFTCAPSYPLPELSDTSDLVVVVAEDAVATSVARILGVEKVTADAELTRRMAREERTVQLERHARRERVPIALSTARPTVEIEGKVRGLVAIKPASAAEDGATVQVLVRERPFETLHLESELPLVAVLDVPPDLADESFTSLGTKGTNAIRSALRRADTRLLLLAAEASPTSLEDDAAVRRLLERFVEQCADPGVSETRSRARKALLAVPAFTTIQGNRASIAGASQRTSVRTARYDQPWIGPAEGEEPDPLDRAVLALPSEGGARLAGASPPPARLREIVVALSGKKVVDLTRQVQGLQAERRAARGLIPIPELRGTDVDHVRTIADVAREEPALGRALGIGRVAFTSGRSMISFFRDGTFLCSADLKVDVPLRISTISPLATAAPGALPVVEHVTLDAQMALFVPAYLANVLSTTQDAEHPAYVRRALRVGVVRSGLPLELLGSHRVFETTSDELVDLATVKEQGARFGTVLFTFDMEARGRLLEEGRLVLRIQRTEAAKLAAELPLASGEEELRLDNLARTNLARPPRAELHVSASEQAAALRVIALDGRDGRRGFVAPLRPSQSGLRLVRVASSSRSLGELRDPCSWPTLAVVDDPHLQPDRTFSSPRENDALDALREHIAEASQSALADLFAPPSGVLVAMVIDDAAARHLLGQANAPPMRGMLWLDASTSEGRVMRDETNGRFVEPLCFRTSAKKRAVVPTPLRGELLVLGTLGDDVHVLARAAYAQLVTSAAEEIVRLERSGGELHVIDALLAHLFVAARLDVVRLPLLPCADYVVPFFSPPSSLRALAGMLRAQDPISVADDLAEVEERAQETGARVVFVHDRSRAAGVVRDWIGSRARPIKRPTDLEPPRMSKTTAPLVPTWKTAVWLEHELQRLGLGRPAFTFVRAHPSETRLLAYDSETASLVLGTKNVHAIALEAAIEASPANAARGLALLAAHAFGLVNRALEEVTDGAEMGAVSEILARLSASRPS